VIELAPQQLIEGAEIAGQGADGRPAKAEIDSRRVTPGDLFFGLTSGATDGGAYARDAIEAGAWGVVVERGRATGLAESGAWVFAVDDPLAALQRAARAWRRELGCQVVGITGSTGKTSVKDITRALLPSRVHASPENFNTEIGLPLTILSAPPETETLVLEMAMRGAGQIAELCAIAEPDVGAITNVGPVHLELLGTLEAIAEAKAEILQGLGRDGIAVVPADAEALAPHVSAEMQTITFGAGGLVFARDHVIAGDHSHMRADIATPLGEATFELGFGELHNLTNVVCAVAIGTALGVEPAAMAPRAADISFSRLRGELIALPGGSVLVNDCYNANPISMRAALNSLVARPVTGRRIAVLGGMGELGPDGPGYHREIGAHVRELGVDVLVGVGELARDYAPDAWAPAPADAVALVRQLVGDGDAILVKGSRAVGLETFTDLFVGAEAEA
jgi:UDP-N-acetylmuramoyl-tripeptide--D-alanyl-D-alanine ligase